MPTVTHIRRPWIKYSESQSEKATDPFYTSTPWRKLRKYTLTIDPLCYYCKLTGIKRLATIGDHYRTRKIFPELELTPSNIKGSCDHHHNQKRHWERSITTKEQFDRLISELMDKFTGE